MVKSNGKDSVCDHIGQMSPPFLALEKRHNNEALGVTGIGRYKKSKTKKGPNHSRCR